MVLKLIPWAKSQDWIFSSQYLKDKFYTPMSEQYIYNKKKEIQYLFKKEGLHWTITCNKNLSEWQALSHVGLFEWGSWTVSCQAPPPMGFSRQQYWSGLPFPSPRDRTRVSRIAGSFFTIWGTREALLHKQNAWPQFTFTFYNVYAPIITLHCSFKVGTADIRWIYKGDWKKREV